MQSNETPQPEQKTASELHTQLGIGESFKDWIYKQPGFANFKSFFGKLPGGGLGKDYRLTPKQCEAILKAQQTTGSQMKPVKKQAAHPKKPRLQPKPGVELADGHYSIESYTLAMFGIVFPDKRGKRIGISLSAIARLKNVTLEKTPHAVWGEVNAYPKALLDKFFGINNIETTTEEKQ
jgi:hypothetical protein